MFIRYAVLFFLVTSVASVSFGKKWTHDQVMAFHRSIALESNLEESLQQNPTVEKYVLPTGEAFSQQNSGLCWSYATMAMLESDYLVRHPGVHIRLSRSVMQYLNMEDRYLRKIHNIEDNLYEGGTPVNAIELIRAGGIFNAADYHLNPSSASLKNPIPVDFDQPENVQISQLFEGLDRIYVPLPKVTHTFDTGTKVLPQELAQEVLGNDEFIAYGAPWDGKPMGWGPHYDPDSRSGTKAKYLSEKDFYELIHSSLKAGHALTINWGPHEESLYGAEFNANGIPTVLYIEGSYITDYHYKAAGSAVKHILGFTTINAGF